MSNFHIHAAKSAKRYGGIWTDYADLHEKMDCSKLAVADNRHRALTHHPFWVDEVMVPLFGSTRENSEGKIYSVRQVCLDHILEDFQMKFIPTAQDYIQQIEYQDWMQNGKGVVPPSSAKLYEVKKAMLVD